MTGNLSVNDDKFQVLGADGNIYSAGSLEVSELSSTSLTLTGNFAVAGTMLSSGNLSVNGNKFVVYMDSGNTNVAGNLLSSGNLSVNDEKKKLQ